mgnify:CR=1 FL=1
MLPAYGTTASLLELQWASKLETYSVLSGSRQTLDRPVHLFYQSELKAASSSESVIIDDDDDDDDAFDDVPRMLSNTFMSESFTELNKLDVDAAKLLYWINSPFLRINGTF